MWKIKKTVYKKNGNINVVTESLKRNPKEMLKVKSPMGKKVYWRESKVDLSRQKKDQ